MNTTRSVILGILLVILWIPKAQAHVVQALTVKDLQQRAQIVVQGQVIKQRSLWKDRIIFTLSTIRVQQCWKLICQSKEITVQQLGGTVGDLTMKVYGIAHLKIKTKVLLFLHKLLAQKNQAKSYSIVGLAQGLFRYITHNKKEWLVQDNSRLLLVSTSSKVHHGRLQVFSPSTITKALPDIKR